MPKSPDFPDTAPDELRQLPDTKDAVRYPKGAQVVRALLERHNIKRSQHVLVVSKIFGLGKSAAHYRLTGGTAWSWEDIEALANALGSSLNEVLSAELNSAREPAQLVFGSMRADVFITLGQGVPGTGDLWAAYRGPDNALMVCEASAIGPSITPMPVAELFMQQTGQLLRVAVLDDQQDTADSISAMLASSGCAVETFTDGKKLLADMEQRSYDAFVIDWLIDGGRNTSETILAKIRETQPSARIVLLTGQIGRDAEPNDIANDIAHAQARLKFVICQKPITASLLMSNLSLDVEARGATL